MGQGRGTLWVSPLIVCWKENMSISVSCSTSLCFCVNVCHSPHRFTLFLCVNSVVLTEVRTAQNHNVLFICLPHSHSPSSAIQPLQAWSSLTAGRHTLRQRRPLRCMQAYWISPDWPPCLFLFWTNKKRSQMHWLHEYFFLAFCFFPWNVKSLFMHRVNLSDFCTFFIFYAALLIVWKVLVN